MTTNAALFENKQVRREWYLDERRFSIVDVVYVLTESSRARKYRSDLKIKLTRYEGFSEMSEKIGQLKFMAADGKKYLGDAANTETILRIIQSIPSPKAEPFKQRLASLGNQRIDESSNPELGIQRARERAIQIYKSRGMSEKEIKQRLESIDIRHDYTDELKARGVENKEYGILTNISYTRSGKSAKEYKYHKGLNVNDNLRDHMTRTEMLLTGISEETGTEIAKSKNAHGFHEVQDALFQGADIAKRTREHIEEKIGKSILDPNNRLSSKQKSLRKQSRKQESLGYNDANKKK